MATKVTLKIKFQDTVHRVLLQSHQVNYDAVAETIQEICPGEVVAKYRDDEGDLRVLCAATFSNFLSPSGTEGGNTVLVLELFPVVLASDGAQPAERAELETASPMATALHALQRPEGNFKGEGNDKGKHKGEWKGISKGKGKCKGKSLHGPKGTFKGKGKSKGETKFSFKGKGKGKRKGKREVEGKGGCEKRTRSGLGGRSLGPMCIKRPTQDTMSVADTQDTMSVVEEPTAADAAAAAADGGAGSPRFDVPFPVAVGDGRRVTPERNLDSDPQQVVEAFTGGRAVV